MKLSEAGVGSVQHFRPSGSQMQTLPHEARHSCYFNACERESGVSGSAGGLWGSHGRSGTDECGTAVLHQLHAHPLGSSAIPNNSRQFANIPHHPSTGLKSTSMITHALCKIPSLSHTGKAAGQFTPV